ncbi:MAG: hypothetical protein WC080_01415 [Patescibacteria group bacterium]|jgi:hypothetical protein
MDKSTKRKSWIIAIIIIVVVIVAAGFGGYYVNKKYLLNKHSVRQAVFLTNGQVYFGYISNSDDQIVKLTDIYYLKTTTDLQNSNTDQNKKVSLIKLGSELHGPEDQMYINRDQILFFEDMKSSSKIMDAINKFSSQQ